jgi:hypothetical protein
LPSGQRGVGSGGCFAWPKESIGNRAMKVAAILTVTYLVGSF